MNAPKKLTNRLQSRKENNALRNLTLPTTLVDFSSNDYLGFAQSETIFKETHQYLINHNFNQNGATGSRLLSGNHCLYNDLEKFLSEFHQTASATIFNSGYDANIGFFSSVPQRGDIILYDELSHASIRDGIKLSNAKAFKFLHNDLEDLEKMLKRLRPLDCAQGDKEILNQIQQEVYVVTESVFSMDGDSPDLVAISKICKKYNAFLIVDEAHAIGVFGAGLVQKLNLQNDVFARIITFGKAMGCHGAAILGSKSLQNYLVNFARSFIYTTGLPPHSLATIKMAYQQLRVSSSEFEKNEQICIENPQDQLQKNIHHFIKEVKRFEFPMFPFGEMSERQWGFIPSCSAIQCCIIPENSTVKLISEKLHQKGFDVKAILSPTVPKGKERLRFCLHSYNSTEEISKVLEVMRIFV
ncbi:aminotransferase class I/II-fold pyridoxal phosphate-dependent enzyme [Polaribacter sp. M15]